MSGQARDDGGVPTVKELYEILRNIEAHWTKQVQDQQTRMATVLSVNGFLLGFVSVAVFSGIGSGGTPEAPVTSHLLWLSIVMLSAAAMVGTLALLPRVVLAGSGKKTPGAAAGAAKGDEEPAPRFFPRILGRGERLQDDDLDTVQRRGVLGIVEWFLDLFTFKPVKEFADGDYWLNSKKFYEDVKEKTSGSTDGPLWDMCKQLSANQEGHLKMRNTISYRRCFMHWQLLLVWLGVAFLMAGVVARFWAEAPAAQNETRIVNTVTVTTAP